MKANFGIVGLGTMGSQLALNAAENGLTVAVYNRDIGSEKGTVAKFIDNLSKGFNVLGYTDYGPFVECLESPKAVLLMVPAGKVVDIVISELLPFLKDGDIIIDGGNSFYKDTRRRFETLKKDNLNFIGCGISGGSEGARNGCSMMPGGSKKGFEYAKELFSSLSSKDKNGTPCMDFIGSDGAGHFVKMVHNGIEYGEMQLIAETYSYLSINHSKEEIADLFSSWTKNGQSSYLLEITIDILRKKDKDGYILDRISDKASGKGTGQWSVNAGLELGSVVSVMAAALNARLLSSDIGLRQKNSSLNNIKKSENLDSSALENAFKFARLINHLQGFHLLQQASVEYNWNLNLKEIARVWTNGCIIRSELMEKLAFSESSWQQLLDLEFVHSELKNNLNSIQSLVLEAAKNLLPMDAYSAAFNYWLAINTQKLPTNMIQGQRDYFGNHGFKLADESDDNLHHFTWH